jgi:hypothetical protein
MRFIIKVIFIILLTIVAYMLIDRGYNNFLDGFKSTDGTLHIIIFLGTLPLYILGLKGASWLIDKLFDKITEDEY